MVESASPKPLVCRPLVILDGGLWNDVVAYDIRERLPIMMLDWPQNTSFGYLFHYAEYPRFYMALVISSIVLSPASKEALINLYSVFPTYVELMPCK